MTFPDPEHIRHELFECGRCGYPIMTQWVYNGNQCLGLDRGAYSLFGDTIFCLACEREVYDELEKLNGSPED